MNNKSLPLPGSNPTGKPHTALVPKINLALVNVTFVKTKAENTAISDRYLPTCVLWYGWMIRYLLSFTQKLFQPLRESWKAVMKMILLFENWSNYSNFILSCIALYMATVYSGSHLLDLDDEMTAAPTGFVHTWQICYQQNTNLPRGQYVSRRHSQLSLVTLAYCM